jgi:tetratricopeptide (TPR) repeat protein
LGRLDEATAAYDEGIRRYEQIGDQRGIAGGKNQIGSICLARGFYDEALQAFEEALGPFEQLNEPNAIAVILLQIGKVQRQLGDPEAAEDAYRESLALAMQIADVGHQANTLNELGILYQELPGRLEEAAGFFQQAVNKSVETGDVTSEGFYRNSLADVARLLKQYDTARQEVVRAIDCGLQFPNTSQLWSSWGLLATIETEVGNAREAANAHRKAVECYVEYRRRGGKNPSTEGLISHAVTEHLLAGDSAAAKSYLQENANDPELPSHARTFISALQAIVAGSRDRSLAEAPDLHFGMAA